MGLLISWALLYTGMFWEPNKSKGLYFFYFGEVGTLDILKSVYQLEFTQTDNVSLDNFDCLYPWALHQHESSTAEVLDVLT